ncbi:MAG: 1-phosphofructokinase family hexose kinase [Candidatus Omnitrophota bacterium]|jgi:1-phosphofructokinase family hexose kinase
MPAPVLTITLNPAVDRTVRGAREKLSAGGKGINVSRALKALGVGSVATGFAGGDTGKFIRSALKKERIESRFMEIRGSTRTNLTYIRPGGKISRRIGKGPVISAAEFRDFKKIFARLLRGRKYAVFSGSNANGLTASAYRELIGIAKRKGVKAVLDTRDAALEEGLKAKPDIVKPNIKEARYICGKNPLKCFRVKGARTVLLTMGAAGAAASDGRHTVFARPPKIKAANDVGCGDAFLAGFIAYRLKGKDFSESVRAASAAGAANAASLVPGALNKKDFLWIYSATTTTSETP